MLFSQISTFLCCYRPFNPKVLILRVLFIQESPFQPQKLALHPQLIKAWKKLFIYLKAKFICQNIPSHINIAIAVFILKDEKRIVSIPIQVVCFIGYVRVCFFLLSIYDWVYEGYFLFKIKSAGEYNEKIKLWGPNFSFQERKLKVKPA